MDHHRENGAVKAAGRRPAAEPRGDTRQQIVDAAVLLIADQGFSATSVEEIATRAGVAKGSVYYNFGSKDEMFTAILAEGVGRLNVALRSASAGLEGAPALDALVTELLTQVHANPHFAKLITTEVFRTGRHWQESMRLVRDDSMGAFADIVRRTRPDLDPGLVGAAIFGATLVAGLEWLVFQPERTFADLRAAVLASMSGLLPA